jgi:hypothetical protein
MDENIGICLFSDSCLNLVLRNSENFVSAYPGKVVFGKCSPVGFKRFQYFEFNLFDLHKLYFSIFDIVNFFASHEDLEFTNQFILTKYELNYFFCTKRVIKNNKETKIVVFGIEDITTSTIVFELIMSETELNLFISVLVKILPSALCLSSTELVLFKRTADENATTINLFQKECHCKTYVKKHLMENNNYSEQLLYNLSTFLNYNCEIILIFHKFQTLVDKETTSNNVALILQKTTRRNI